MRSIQKHGLVAVLVVFLIAVPVAANSRTGGQYTPAQAFDPGQFIQKLLTEGAELVFSSIDQGGVPTVLYAQLGIPSDQLQLSSDMYHGCLMMALAGTHGELLNYLLGMAGNITGGGAFNPNQLLDMLGSEFNVMVSLFLNLDQQVSQQRVSAIVAHLQTSFGFTMSSLFQLRIDKSFFPSEMNITLPFDSIDVYIYQVLNEFGPFVDSVLNVMDQDGFLSSFNRTLFTSARASGGLLVAIPDIAQLIGLFNTTMGGLGSFGLSQITGLTGPIAVAGVGYIGDQVVSSTTTELSIGSLIGATMFTPLTHGMSIVVANMPNNVPIVSYAPMHANYSFYDNQSGIVLWNATGFGQQNDYVLNFATGSFPPLITLERVFSPTTTGIGGQTQVTVTVTNEGNQSITNLNLTDNGFLTYYVSLNVTGSTSVVLTSLAPGASTSLTYSVTFKNEGTYAFPGAVLQYTHNSTAYTKHTPKDGFTVTTDLGSVLLRGIADGMPYTGLVLGLIVLGGIWQVYGLVRKRPGTAAYQV